MRRKEPLAFGSFVEFVCESPWLHAFIGFFDAVEDFKGAFLCRCQFYHDMVLRIPPFSNGGGIKRVPFRLVKARRVLLCLVSLSDLYDTAGDRT